MVSIALKINLLNSLNKYLPTILFTECLPTIMSTSLNPDALKVDTSSMNVRETDKKIFQIKLVDNFFFILI